MAHDARQVDPALRALATTAKAWPFEEARKLVARLEGRPKSSVLFETGYGPSGLPHIGTFGEVARTTMVRHAFATLSDVPSRLVAFSDDMDGLRKVPDNIPNKELVAAHLGKPLTQVPDPFGKFESFGHHNNAMLRSFLDRFGFAYEFKSATDAYRSGEFDAQLKAVLHHYDAIMAVMLPTLGAERQATYSPVLPISPKTGRVLQVPLVEVKADAGTVVFRDEDESLVEVPVTGGHVKLQWKADWAMRWVALDVDYEMNGKDLIPTHKLSSQICRILGGTPPEGFSYELFLDENGEKISKSRGNGLTIEEWLRYASPESLALYMYLSPRKAKRLYFDVIPRHVDDYNDHLQCYFGEEPARAVENPVWHIHSGEPPRENVSPISFGLLLNLASVVHSEDKAVLWGFIARYVPGATPADHPMLDRLVGHAMAYYQDFVKPTKRYRAPTEVEREALEALAAFLEKGPDDVSAEGLQNEIYEIGKRFAFANLRDWFKAVYEVVFGQPQGPRLGSFVALFGTAETAALIREALARENVATAG
jgi:lysyl-tRNA synthetase class 1